MGGQLCSTFFVQGLSGSHQWTSSSIERGLLDINDSYSGVKSVGKPKSDGIEEELVISDSWGHVLLFKDFVVVDTELKVGGTVPIKIENERVLLIETSPEVLLGGLGVLVETWHII